MNGTSTQPAPTQSLISAPAGAGRPAGPQSWFDLVVMPTMDPRAIIQFAALQSSVGAFLRSSSFLHAGSWITPPMVVTQPGPGAMASVQATNPQDYEAIVEAATWNSAHAMTVTSAQVPPSVQKIMFLKAGPRFINNVYLSFTGGATSSDLELSFRDNSATSGDFMNAAAGTIPVFSFTGVTFSGTGLNLQLTLLRTGRFNMGLRIIDNGGNYSVFEMDWIVLP